MVANSLVGRACATALAALLAIGATIGNDVGTDAAEIHPSALPDSTDLDGYRTAASAANASAAVDFIIYDPTRLRTGLEPWNVKVDRSGRRGYVLGATALQKLNLTTNPAEVIGTATNVHGYDLAIHPNGRTAYVAERDRLSVVGTVRANPVLRRHFDLPRKISGLVVSPGGGQLYVTTNSSAYGTGTLSVYSLKNPLRPRHVGSVVLDDRIYDVAINPKGTKVVTANGFNTAYIIDVRSKQRPRVIRQLDVSFNPEHVTIASNNKTAYLTGDHLPTGLAKVSLKTNRVQRTRAMNLPTRPSGLDVSPDSALIYVTVSDLPESYTFFAFRSRLLRTAARANGAYFPRAITISERGPTKGRIYIATPGSGSGGGTNPPPLLHAMKPRP